METTENITNLIKAVLKVMGEVKGIEKTMDVGTGTGAYKGIADMEVKRVLGESMQRNGLVILPVDIQPETTISEWTEPDSYKKDIIKRKQQVFTKVLTTYLLAHDSGESITIRGLGHGVDSQDKSAGKATTYALKYALLYTFLVATGYIDDTDTQHSNDLPVSQPTNVENKLIEAIADMNTAKSIAEVSKLWKENLIFQTDPQYIEAAKHRKKLLKPA